MKRILPILLGLCIFHIPMHADEWIVETLSAGNVKVCCSNPGSWSFDVSAIREDNKDIITVNLTNDFPGTPPGVQCGVVGSSTRCASLVACGRNGSLSVAP